MMPPEAFKLLLPRPIPHVNAGRRLAHLMHGLTSKLRPGRSWQGSVNLWECVQAEAELRSHAGQGCMPWRGACQPVRQYTPLWVQIRRQDLQMHAERSDTILQMLFAKAPWPSAATRRLSKAPGKRDKGDLDTFEWHQICKTTQMASSFCL